MSDEPQITIAGREIGPAHPPYVIAEMSGNHNGDITRAYAIMDAAKEAGADALKMQTYTADTITIDHDGPGFTIKGTAWEGRTLHDLYDEAHTPWDWHKPIFDHARKLGITVFSSPFDFTAIDLLESLGAPAYKIASFEAIDIPLIERAASTGKPLIISTGLASRDEIAEAVAAARKAGGQNPAILHCISTYPTKYEDCNLRVLPLMAETFGTVVGFSDHTNGTAAAVAAVALGASIFEKHLTMARADGGPDAAFSLEPGEFKAMVSDCRLAFQARGSGRLERPPAEDGLMVFRRSLYIVADIAEGEIFTERNVRSIRPSYGLPPKHLPDVLGRQARRPLARGTPLSWDAVKS
jgi:N-acetylneuraminate synthase